MKLFNSIQINSLARIKTLYRNFKQLYFNITERVQMVTNYGYKKEQEISYSEFTFRFHLLPWKPLQAFLWHFVIWFLWIQSLLPIV